MKFVASFSMINPSYYLPLARTAEEVGFDAIALADSEPLAAKVAALQHYAETVIGPTRA